MHLSGIEKILKAAYELEIKHFEKRIEQHVSLISYEGGCQFPYADLWTFTEKIYGLSNSELQAYLLSKVSNNILALLVQHHPKLYAKMAQIDDDIQKLVGGDRVSCSQGM